MSIVVPLTYLLPFSLHCSHLRPSRPFNRWPSSPVSPNVVFKARVDALENEEAGLWGKMARGDEDRKVEVEVREGKGAKLNGYIEISDDDEEEMVILDLERVQVLGHGSLSFGKYAHEPLEWAKRSAFTQDKYQEELEELKSPGSFAQKRAKLEEFFKQRRALKAMEEGTQSERKTLNLDGVGDQSRVVSADAELEKQDGEDMESSSTTLDSPIGVSLGVNNEMSNGCDHATARTVLGGEKPVHSRVQEEAKSYARKRKENTPMKRVRDIVKEQVTKVKGSVAPNKYGLKAELKNQRNISPPVKNRFQQIYAMMKTKRQEELKKLESSGLVAQTRAYFERESIQVTKVKEASVSEHGYTYFGSFKFESLEWERRSVFTSNKYQEELDKVKSPGLVAEKKTYFEEYYNKTQPPEAIQENQHSELKLDCVGEGIISNPTDKNETSVHMGSAEDGPSNNMHAHSTEASLEVVSEKKHNYEDLQTQHIDLRCTSTTLHSTRSSESALQMQTEEDSTNFDAKQCNGSSEWDANIYHKDKQLRVNPLFIRTELDEQHQLSGPDDEGASKESCSLELNVGPENSDAVKSDCNIVKRAASLAINGLDVEFKTQTKTSEPSTYHFQQIVGKTKNNARSSNMMHDRVSRISRSSPAGSHKSLSSAGSKTSLIYPLSLGTKRPNRETNLQNSTTKTATACSVKIRGSEKKRGSEQLQETALPTVRRGRVANIPEPPKDQKTKGLENQRDSGQVRHRTFPINCMVGDADMPEPPKTRISRPGNLPAAVNYNSHGGSKSRTTIALRKDDPKEVASSKPDPLAGKGKSRLSGGRSHTATMPRQQMRPWR